MITKYYRILAILFTFLAISMNVHAAYVEIGTGTGATRNVPLNAHYNYSWSGSIYLAGDIGTSITIDSLSYNVDTSTATSFPLSNQRIYLAHTTATTFTSNAYVDPVAAGYTLVYQGSITLIPGEWNTVTLDTAFDYNGTDNLLIYWINESLSAYTPYPQFCYTNQTNRVVYGLGDTGLPATGNINYLLPNVRLHYTPVITEFPYATNFTVFPPLWWNMTGGTCNWAQYNSGTMHCAYANYWGWDEGETAYMTTPRIVLPQNPRLCFYWSYFYNNSYPNDALTVQVSTDEGANWTNVWHRGGSNLSSNDGASYQFPGNMSMIATIDLSAYYGSTVLIRFYGYSGSGPDLFIDNVCVYSTLGTPIPVDPAAPADEATEVFISGNLEWERTGLATGYTLYFGTDNPPTNIVNGVNQGLNVSYAYDDLSLDTMYYWQVVPYNTHGNATDCPVWSFTTQTVPGTSDVIYPYDNTTHIPLNGTFEWTEAVAATGYRLYLGTDTPPTNVINGADAGNVLTYDYSGLAPETTYQWQVVPYNANGNAVDCETWSFTTRNVPFATSCVTPANSSTSRPETGALVWNTVDYAEGYYLYLGTDNPPTNIANGIDIGAQNYYEYLQLSLGTTHYWQVVPYNEAGPASSCPVWSFGTTSTCTSNGTDGTYYFASSIDPVVLSKPTYRWIDTTGHTELTLPVQNGQYDDGNWQVTLPFAFPFYGVDQNSLYITTNGMLAFSATTAYSNTVIPDAGVPNNYIAPMWDNFEYDEDAQIFYGGDAINGFTVTYWHLPSHYHSEYYVTMQTTLFPDGKIIICYRMDESNRNPGTSQGYTYGNTIGIENSDGTLGIQYRYGFSAYIWTGGPFFNPDGDNIALAFGLNQTNLDWPVVILDTPANFVINMTASGAVLSWDAVTGANSYRIYYCDNPNGVFLPMGCVTATTYTDATSANTGYYQVTASTEFPERTIETTKKNVTE